MLDLGAQGSNVAIISDTHKWTYTELDALNSRAASHLAQHHAPGAIIGMHCANDANAVVMFHALLRAGLIAFPISTRLPVVAIEDLLARFSVEALYADSPLALKTSLPRYSSALLEAPETGRTRSAGPSEPATLVLTSGSSGAPKGVLHSTENHLCSASLANANMPLGPGDCWLLSLPLYHVSGVAILFRCALAGAAVAVSPNLPLEESIPALGVSHVSLVATQLKRLMESTEGREALHALRAILLGGGPAPSALLHRAYDMGLPLHNSYGMTETASQVTATRMKADLSELQSAGRPLQTGSVAISPQGEILVRGDSLFLGYKTPEGLVLPLDEHGRFATGDLGRFDDDGNLHVSGRRDNMFISGGENIQPEHIERVLRSHPQVEEAVVVPVPDENYGEVPVVFILTNGLPPLDASTVRDYLLDRVARFEIPRRVFPWPTDIATPGIKPQRRAFQARALELTQSAG